MICPQCGAQTPDGSTFCKTCGASLVGTGPVSVQQPQPQYVQPQQAQHVQAQQPREQVQPQQAQPSPDQEPSTVSLTRFLTIVAICLVVVVIALIIATIVIRSGDAQSQGADSAQVTNVRLADAYDQVLDDISNVEFVQEGDSTTYDLSGTYHYTLIDLRDDGTPDLVVAADATAHTQRGDVDCTLARVIVYDEKTDTTMPIGSTIRSGSSIKMLVTDDLHGLAVRGTNAKTGQTLCTQYTLKDKNETSESTEEQKEMSNPDDYLTPNLVNADNRSLIELLRAGTWTDGDAVV